MQSFGVGARLQKSSFLLLFVGTISLHWQNVSSSRKSCIQLDNDDDIQKYLTSSKNYYNISRALFPSPGNPSMYVKIWVRFNTTNSSSSSNNNFTMRHQKKYTWSKSCLYVATQFISLSAINLYSIGAVWPNRRGAELSITIPEFCNATKEEINAKMIYFLSTLEDVAINTKTQDPRLNTVECVVEGHDDFSVKIFSGVRQLLMCACWCIGFISFVVGFVMSCQVIPWLNANLNKETEESSQTTTTVELQSLMKRAAEEIVHQHNDAITVVVAYKGDKEEGKKKTEESSQTTTSVELKELMTKAAEGIIHQVDNDAITVVVAYKGDKEEGKKSKPKADTVLFLICILAVIQHILAILAVCLTFTFGHSGFAYPLVFLLFLHVGFLFYYTLFEKGPCKKEVFLFLFGPSGCVVLVHKCLKNNKKNLSEPEKLQNKQILKKTIFTVTHLTLLMSVHHFLWILLGVMTEPLWAIPVLVVNGCFWFCIYLSAYYFAKEKGDLTLKEKRKAVTLSVTVVICVMLALLVLGVTAQSFLGTDPLTVIVSGTLSIIASWFLKNLWNKNDKHVSNV